MDELFNTLKCGNCNNVLDSPVLLPCGDSICQKHTAEKKDLIFCHTCGIEHSIPVNGGFPLNKGLQGVVNTKIAFLDFGDEHKQAKESCKHFDDLLTKIDQLLKDPYNFIYDAIGYLKSVVQLKGEEMILKITEKMHQIISKLDEYKENCKNGFSQNAYVVKSENFVAENKNAREELKKWSSTLNEIKFNEQEWKRIKSESEKAIESFENKMVEFKIDIFPDRFEEFRSEIENEFGKFKIDPTFDINKSSQIKLDSTIITELSFKNQFFQLCGFDSSQKLDLLYRGSVHGFKAGNFHSRCDNIPKTLTIIKATSGNIFGGFTEAAWDQSGQYKLDKNAFLFSLVNKENNPVKVNIANGKEGNAIFCNPTYGPTFGNDVDIIDDSNISNNNVSNIGNSYILENYPKGSEKAKAFLAGSFKFTVEEIEVFQLN